MKNDFLPPFSEGRLWSPSVAGMLAQEDAMLEAVTIREIEAIFAITDRLGIHRESLVIPLLPRHPGRVRRMPNGKIEIVVEKEGELADFLAGLEAELEPLRG